MNSPNSPVNPVPGTLAAETAGTFMLTFAGTATALAVHQLQTGSTGTTTLDDLTIGAALAFGLIAAVYAVSGLSGAHLNPAITTGLAAVGRFPADTRESPHDPGPATTFSRPTSVLVTMTSSLRRRCRAEGSCSPGRGRGFAGQVCCGRKPGPQHGGRCVAAAAMQLRPKACSEDALKVGEVTASGRIQ